MAKSNNRGKLGGPLGKALKKQMRGEGKSKKKVRSWIGNISKRGPKPKS